MVFVQEPYPMFHEWLINQRHTGYPHMSEESLEGHIVSMFEWWDDRKKKINQTGTGQT
jgi:hypothetical protein